MDLKNCISRSLAFNAKCLATGHAFYRKRTDGQVCVKDAAEDSRRFGTSSVKQKISFFFTYLITLEKIRIRSSRLH